MHKFLSLIVVLSVAGTVLAGGGEAQAEGPCFDNSWGDIVCAPDEVADAIYAAADYYGASSWELFAVASCENNFDQWAIGPFGEIGVFQFLPETFYGFAPDGDIWSIWDQAYVAAYAFAHGEQGLWTCWDRI